MAVNNSYSGYLQNKIMTSSSEDLIVMLFDGAVKFINQAKLNMEHNNINKSNECNQRAQDIYVHLMSTVDADTAMGKSLYSLYDFVLWKLIEANMQKNMTDLDIALDFTVNLRDTFKSANTKLKADHAKQFSNQAGQLRGVEFKL